MRVPHGQGAGLNSLGVFLRENDEGEKRKGDERVHRGKMIMVDSGLEAGKQGSEDMKVWAGRTGDGGRRLGHV